MFVYGALRENWSFKLCLNPPLCDYQNKTAKVPATSSTFFSEYLIYKKVPNSIPSASGHNFLQQVMPPSWVYWPIVVSSRNRGTPQVTTKTRYGTRKAPKCAKYTTVRLYYRL